MAKREEPTELRQLRLTARVVQHEASAVPEVAPSAAATASDETTAVPEPAGEGPSAGPTASAEEAGDTPQRERREPRFVFENPRVPIPVQDAEGEAAAELTGGSRFPEPPFTSKDYQRLQAAQAVLDQLPATSNGESLVEEPDWSPSIDTTSSRSVRIPLRAL